MADYNLNGKVVLITGASGGIGSECATALYARGASLVLTDLAQEAVDRLAAGMDSRRVLPRALDVTDRAATDAVVAEAVARFGKLDVVFANAGISAGPITANRLDQAAFDKVVAVNLHGVWHTVKACLPQVIANQGYVLITSSVYAFANGMANVPYAMSKAAVEMLGRSLRAELAYTGAKAGVLYPGWTATPIAAPAFGGNAIATRMIKHAFPGPFGKTIAPRVVAQAVVAGMQRRRSRIFAPRRWVPLSMIRGLFNMLSDWKLDTDREMHDMVRSLDDESRRNAQG